MFSYIPDILLILISSMACLYCLLLSRRLKKLQNLESGLGASILSLTDAIVQTTEAAQHARSSTEESVTVLRNLLLEAQNALPQVEARIESLRYSRIAAQTAHSELDKILNSEIKPELKNARQTSKSLLHIVKEVSDFQNHIKEACLRKTTSKSIEKERVA
jgi:thioredoxin-related protein